MASIGVRALKARLSELLKRAAAGERVTITNHGRPVAIVGPVAEGSSVGQLETMIHAGLAQWSGGKPQGAKRPARLKRGASVARAVIEDRS